ncbi:DUF6157 family protein [Arthrobacter sp.]|uniref:DUF6157 family protein n=1 Tax=Arthrobacter sp. TaxID=1667 RepID=UPI0026DEB115|nr:DUF6157 family protein [Arthrobacter sp.]MDO5753655.1 DUF6157 family protein [Arthrobacter sp.]
MHTTNYVNTLIAIADDCPADHGVIPPVKLENPSIASRTFQLISQNPYRFTSDDVIFTVYADRAGLTESERPSAREHYFSKGRPCLRASDLGKKYGWGVHANADGHVALYAVNSPEYAELSVGKAIQSTTPDHTDCPVAVVKAMRSSRR